MAGAALFFGFFPLILGFMFGACLGSFSSALLWRLPRGIPWIYDEDGHFVRSCCPSCQRVLAGRDLIPVLSWVIQAGRCRGCDVPISGRYPLLEVGSGIIGAMMFGVIGLSLASFLILTFVVFLFIFLWVGFMHKVWARDIFVILAFLLFFALIWGAFTGF